MQTTKYPITWDLESIFPGGSESPQLMAHLEALEQDHAPLLKQMSELPLPTSPEALDAWAEAFAVRENLFSRMWQAGAYLGCLNSSNTKDMKAKVLQGRLAQMFATFSAVEIALKEKIRATDEESWQKLLADERFAPLAFRLEEVREEVGEMLSPEQEKLLADLSVDGYQAWARLYSTIVSRVEIEVETDGKVEKLSAGQAYNRFAHPDPAFRAELMKKWEAAWADQAELCAAALNSIGGFRLTNYRWHKFESPLERGLKGNRMTEATLNAMWDAINEVKPTVVEYFNRKAKLIGVDKLHWYDEQAPLGEVTRQIPWDEAAEFIMEHFQKFSPKMADFAKLAFEKGWIEAEDRANKGAGGYCTSLPLSKESRIFMTYSGTPDGVGTLAHELGHAYHNYVQVDLPFMARGATMSTAETASTFAELVVARAAQEAAESHQERISLLDDAAKRAATMFMNLHARFIFENKFYEARKKGVLGVEQLNKLMEESQKEAFRDGLGSYHPHFWCSKGHFYGTGVPFYNYPYVFGYLFAAGVYARALEEGASFEDKYIALLRDTGRMTTEEIAQRHMGVDLTKPDFWQAAVDLVMADVRQFLELTA